MSLPQDFVVVPEHVSTENYKKSSSRTTNKSAANGISYENYHIYPERRQFKLRASHGSWEKFGSFSLQSAVRGGDCIYLPRDYPGVGS